MNKENNKTAYEDIINLSHPISKTHPQMTLHDRAAQFAPFAALTGHHDAIKETARLTQKKIELSEEEKEKLNQKLLWIIRHIKRNPQILITYFVQDLYKEGGNYITREGKVKKVVESQELLVMEDQNKILWEDIYSVEIKNPQYEKNHITDSF